jgi:hypothetical protein
VGELVRAPVVVAQIVRLRSIFFSEWFFSICSTVFFNYFSHPSIGHLILHIFGVDSPEPSLDAKIFWILLL